MKNILLVVPRFNIGGAETYVHTVALGLQARGFKVYVASGGGLLAEAVRRQGITHCFLPIRANKRLAAYMLGKIIRKYNIDLVHANSAAAGIVAVQAKAETNIPVVYTAHGVFGHNAAEMTINDCDRIICVSDFVRKYALAKGFSAEKLQTVYTGIDLNKFKPDPARAALVRRKCGIPEDSFVIALVARIKNLRNKGHADMLDVLARYQGAKDWHLMVIGKGKGTWQLKYAIWQKKLGKRVHPLGHIVNVQDVLDGADAAVLPSQFETFGLVLAEAMAMEKPVVTYAVGGTPEVINNNHTGFLVEKDNLDSLYEKLELLANDRTLQRTMGQEGRKWVEQQFSEPVMLEELISIYRNLGSKERK